jgi:hypothetical protein
VLIQDNFDWQDLRRDVLPGERGEEPSLSLDSPHPSSAAPAPLHPSNDLASDSRQPADWGTTHAVAKCGDGVAKTLKEI